MSSRLLSLAVWVSLVSASALALDTTERSYALALPDGGYVMSGGVGRSHSFDALRKKHGERYLWFERDGAEYAVTDPALLAKLDAPAAKVLELGKKQGALGREQGKLGGRQGRLGAAQGRLGARIAQAALREDEAEQRRIEQEQARIEDEQEALGREQEALAKQQEALSEEHERAAEALARQIEGVAAEALKSGKAKRL